MTIQEAKTLLRTYFVEHGDDLVKNKTISGTTVDVRAAHKLAGDGECALFLNLAKHGQISFYVYGSIDPNVENGLLNKLKAEQAVGKLDLASFGGEFTNDENEPKGRGHVIDVKCPDNFRWTTLNQDADATAKEKILETYQKFLAAITNAGAFALKGRLRRKGKGNTSDSPRYSYNCILFGAPGTGKSHELEEARQETYSANPQGGGDAQEVRYFEEQNFERVTFYANYSYAQFVGTYKPIMGQVDKDGFPVETQPNGNPPVKTKPAVQYRFVPGPFLRMLVKALKCPKKRFLLIVEEINRANAAAVFGDMFQLLDRDADGVGKYAVSTSEDVRQYLIDCKVAETASLRLPANLYIWATMNSADQGVFPLDTAFKRRWEFEYLTVDEQGENLMVEAKGGSYSWRKLRKALNNLLIENGVNEDKLIGPYFVAADEERFVTKHSFETKVLMYLWEDAAKMCRRNFFNNDVKTFSQLCNCWDKKTGPDDGDNKSLLQIFRLKVDDCPPFVPAGDEEEEAKAPAGGGGDQADQGEPAGNPTANA